MSEFQEFQKEFKKYQHLFGLTGYKVYFKYEPLDKDCFADITLDQSQMVATARLNKSVDKDPQRDVKQSAKHEAIHLLLMKLQRLAMCRYLFESDISEATEELVFKLEELIP